MIPTLIIIQYARRIFQGVRKATLVNGRGTVSTLELMRNTGNKFSFQKPFLESAGCRCGIEEAKDICRDGVMSLIGLLNSKMAFQKKIGPSFGRADIGNGNHEDHKKQPS